MRQQGRVQRMRKKKHKAEKENSERWLITYSDLITLLLIFFVIMYAMSSLDKAKFNILSASLNAALDPSNEIPLPGLGKTALISAANPTVGSHTGNTGTKATTPITKQEITQISSIIKEDKVFSNLYQELHNYITKNGLQSSVAIQNQQRGVQITLHDMVFFNTGSDQLRTQAMQTLAKLVPFLKTVNNDIIVEGYTDNIPIRTYLFPSNWELSTGRAVNVVKFLIANGIDPNRLAATGYSKYHPIAANTTSANRQQNRRVNIVVLRSYVSSLAGFGGQTSSSTGFQLNNSSLAAIRQALGPNPNTVISHNVVQQSNPRPQIPTNLFGSGTSSQKP